MTNLRSADVPNTTRVTFDIDLGGVSETFADDRTPTGLTRYAEKDITMGVGHLAGGNVIIPSVRFERVEETTSAEPLTAQSEPRPVAVAEELDFDALDVKLRGKLKEAGFVSGSRTEIVGILRELLTDGHTPTKPLKQEPDVDAFISELDVLLAPNVSTGSRRLVSEAARKLLTEDFRPTKRLQGQGLNREQLTDVIAKSLDKECTTAFPQTMARAIVADIEAAQLDGSLT